MRKLYTNAIVGLAVVGLMAGCSSGDESSGKDGSKDVATATTAAAGDADVNGSSGGADTGRPPVTGVIERYEGEMGDGVAEAVETDHCDTTPGAVTAAGTIQLPEGKQGDVIISVGWVNASTGTVIAKRIVEVSDVKSDSASSWSTEVDLPENEGVTVSCNVGAFIKV